MSDASLTLLVALPLATALLAPLAVRLPWAHGWLAGVPAGLTAWLFYLLGLIRNGEPAAFHLAWIPDLGLDLSLRADGLSLLYALLITGIGTLVVLYSGGYLAGESGRSRFYGWLFAFMTGMLGVALADNLLLLFLFWEVTTFSSFMLIGFHHEGQASREAALKALVVTAFGGLAMVAGLILLGQLAGSYQISVILETADPRDSHLYLPIVGLILLGAATKSALFPFHFWLPAAMAAPTPVSAYLHAATMVKAGIYLLLRLQPVLGDTQTWHWSVGGLGAFTMVMGATLAPLQPDLKRLLAYATISVLGLLTFMIGLGTDAALHAALVFMVAHGLYKGALFFVAGTLDHETGSRDLRRLRGLGRLLPLTCLAAALAAASMGGIPPWIGFVAKESVLEEALHHSGWLAALVVWTGACFVLAGGLMAIAPFRGRTGEARPAPGEDTPTWMWLAPLLLGLLGLVAGLFPQLLQPLVEAAGRAAGQEEPIELALWHGFTPTLALSLTSIALGALLYGLRRHWCHRLWGSTPAGPSRVYRWSLTGLFALARGQTTPFQGRNLPWYLAIMLLTLIGVVGWGLIALPQWRWPGISLAPRLHEVGVVGLVFVSMAGAVLLRSRLATIAALGATGYSISLLYLVFGAPDLAMVQLLIESLTAILFVVAFHRLPALSDPDPRGKRLFHAAIAVAGGGVMTALIWLALMVETGPRISDYYAEHSAAEALGHNVVNVIVVDFRGMDTLGEITVLAIAALGGAILIRERRRRQDRERPV